jgi:hypothetical protein
MGRVCVVLLALALSGCVAKQVWNKDGASEMDFNKDKYDCELAQQPRPIGLNEELYSSCMEARGWKKGGIGFARPFN